jgi:glycerophosphoryl diester phosphodiesterase
MANRALARSRFFRAAGDRPLVLAHRGASAQETENTCAAFARAMAEGADGVELDVQSCATGEVVVFHDDDLRRLAGRPERIAALSWSALREVRLRGGATIPTLAEALAACGPTGLVNIEIKHAGPCSAACRALVAGSAAEVARAGAAERVLVSSFSPVVVWRWRKLHPDVPCGLLCERPRPFHRPWPWRMDRLLPLLRPAAVHPEDRLCTPALVARWRRRGLLVNVWTVDQPERMRELAAMGVSGIITNQPAQAGSVLALTRRSAGG